MNTTTIPLPPRSHDHRTAGLLAMAAVAASGGAALVHASMAGDHDGALAVGAFLGVAAAQLAVPLLALVRGGRWWVLLAVINGVSVAAYVAAVLGAAPLLHDGPELLSVLGVLTLGLELVAVAGGVSGWAVGGPVVRAGAGAGAVAVAVVPVLVAVTALGLAPTHAADGHSAGGHAHGGADVEVTAEQQARADELVAATRGELIGFVDPATAEEAGYRWIGDGRRPGGYRHYVHAGHLADPTVLEPTEVESLVYRNDGDDVLTLVSAMYILPPGSTADDVPDVAGGLTVWHDHDDLCWGEDGRIAGVSLPLRGCPRGSTARGTPPMLHVWTVDNPDGPFAGIDGHGGHGGHG